MGFSFVSTSMATGDSGVVTSLIILFFWLVFFVVGIAALIKFFQIAKDVRLMRYRMDNIYQTLNKIKDKDSILTKPQKIEEADSL